MKQSLLVSAILLFSACEQANPQPQMPARPVEFDAALSSMTFARAPDATPVELSKAAHAALVSTVEITSQATDWREAHTLVGDAVEAADTELTRSMIEQSTAKLLLVGYLIPNAEQKGAADLALSYARVLADRRSPEAGVVLASIKAFDEQWGSAEARSIAIEAADAAEQYAASTKSCLDCEVPEAARRSLSESGQTTDVANARRLDAARQLRAIVE